MKKLLPYVMRWAIWYHLHNLKNVKSTHGGVLILVKLQATLLKLTLRITYLKWVNDLLRNLPSTYIKHLDFFQFLRLKTLKEPQILPSNISKHHLKTVGILSYTEMYLEPSQTSKMELYGKIFNGWKLCSFSLPFSPDKLKRPNITQACKEIHQSYLKGYTIC